MMDPWSQTDEDIASLSSAELIKAVSKLKSKKAALVSDISRQKKAQQKCLEVAFQKIHSVNEDQANKHFKSPDNAVFSDKFNAMIKSLRNEIKKLELVLEVQTSVDDELEKSLTELSARELELQSLRSSSSCKNVKHSNSNNSYQDHRALANELSSGNRVSDSEIPVAINVNASRFTAPDFPDVAAFEENFSRILEQREMELQTGTASLRSALRAKTTHMVQSLEAQARRVAQSLSVRRDQDYSTIDERYGELLAEFIAENEVTSERFLRKYQDRLNARAEVLRARRQHSEQQQQQQKVSPSPVMSSSRRRRTASSNATPVEVGSLVDMIQSSLEVPSTRNTIAGGGQGGDSGSGNEDSESCGAGAVHWKTEVDSRYLGLLVEDERCRRMEGEIDALLMQQMRETQVVDNKASTVEIDEAYLEGLMVKLAALYAETNEAALKASDEKVTLTTVVHR